MPEEVQARLGIAVSLQEGGVKIWDQVELWDLLEQIDSYYDSSGWVNTCGHGYTSNINILGLTLTVHQPFKDEEYKLHLNISLLEVGNGRVTPQYFIMFSLSICFLPLPPPLSPPNVT